jgi:hypothetical protein
MKSTDSQRLPLRVFILAHTSGVSACLVIATAFAELKEATLEAVLSLYALNRIELIDRSSLFE